METEKIIITIPKEKYLHILELEHGNTDYAITRMLYHAVKHGTPLPKGHGRLIDADAFIDGLRDASKRQRYNECLIDENLTVDDVFQAVIESLENKGLASGDAPVIVEADKDEELEQMFAELGNAGTDE